MNQGRSWNRWAIETVLTVCAVIIWAYDIHVILSPNPPALINMPVEAESFVLSTDTFPWESGTLPRITWNPFPAEPESIAISESVQKPQPPLILQGLYLHGSSKAALIREVETDETRLMFEGDSWNGVTLQEVGNGWVRLINGNTGWKITLPSMIDPER